MKSPLITVKSLARAAACLSEIPGLEMSARFGAYSAQSWQGLALAGARPLTGSGFWLLLGLGCLIFYWFTQTKYTVLHTDAGSVWVMDDKQSATILAELQSRRKQRTLELYGDYNSENDPERETQKFDWLVKEDVLSRDEADKRIAAAEKEAGLLTPPQQLLN